MNKKKKDREKKEGGTDRGMMILGNLFFLRERRRKRLFFEFDLGMKKKKRTLRFYSVIFYKKKLKLLVRKTDFDFIVFCNEHGERFNQLFFFSRLVCSIFFLYMNLMLKMMNIKRRNREGEEE